MIQTTEYVGTLFDNSDNPNKITVALTMGNKALEKGFSASLILMVDAVHLAIPDSLKSVDIGAPFQKAIDLQESFLQKGGRILVCQACMVHNNVSADAIDSRFSIISADDVIELLMNAKGTLALN